MENARSLLSDVAFGSSPYQVAEGAHALVIVTEWEAFRALDLPRLRAIMANPLLVDCRNIYVAADVARHGLCYVGVGTAADMSGGGNGQVALEAAPRAGSAAAG
jgi:UDPglucose 6-dehydrogenase